MPNVEERSLGSSYFRCNLSRFKKGSVANRNFETNLLAPP